VAIVCHRRSHAACVIGDFYPQRGASSATDIQVMVMVAVKNGYRQPGFLPGQLIPLTQKAFEHDLDQHLRIALVAHKQSISTSASISGWLLAGGSS
jgi:hypothetical protein